MDIKIRMGSAYDEVLLLVADLDGVYGVRGKGTAGMSFILQSRRGENMETGKERQRGDNET